MTEQARFPGYPSSPSLLRYVSLSAFASVVFCISALQRTLSKPLMPPCRWFGPSFVARLYPVLSQAEPNSAHKAVAELEIICNVDYIFTGSTDGLQQKSGSSLVVELFGSILWVTCPNCGKDYSLEQINTQLQDGKKIPACEECNNDLLKPPISFPGQPLPHWELREAWMKLHNCDLFFIIGAYLDDSPLSSLQTIAAESGSKIAIVNERQSEADNYADAVIYGKPTMVISHIVSQIKKDIKAS